MKRQITSIIMLVITFGLCIWEMTSLNISMNQFKNEVYNIQTLYTENQIEKAIERTDTLIKKWCQHKILLSSFIDHNPLMDIENSLEAMKITLENDEAKDFFIECKKSIIQLDDIRTTEMPLIRNIL